MIKELRIACKKEELEPITTRLFRIVSIYPTAFFIKVEAHPNWISYYTIIFLVFGSALLAIGWFVWGAYVILVSFIFDLCDGEVARYTKKLTSYGMYLEILGSNLFYGLPIICLAIGWYHETGFTAILYLGISAVIAKYLYRFNEAHKGGILKSLGNENKLVNSMTTVKRVQWETYSFLFTGGGMHIILFTCIMAGWIGLPIIFWGITIPIILIIQSYNHWRELTSRGRTRNLM